MHEDEVGLGRSARDVMGDRTHRAYYEHRMRNEISAERMVIKEGNSHEILDQFPDEFLDLIYIDALHTYDAVRKDTDVAVNKLAKTGIIFLMTTQWRITRMANYMVLYR
jgi:hypothetical protein